MSRRLPYRLRSQFCALVASACVGSVAALPAFFALPFLAPAGAQAAEAGSVPGTTGPNLIRPQLPDGFQPLGPSNFGLSPAFNYFVQQDGRVLRVIRQDAQVEVLRLQVQGYVQVGFDSLDKRMYVLEEDNNRYRFRFINPRKGNILLDQRYQERPEIRTDYSGANNVLAVRKYDRTQVLLFDAAGRQTSRGNFSATVRISVNLFSPSVAFIDTDRYGRTQFEVVNSVTGRLTLRETVTGQYDAGFEPAGSAFVIAAGSQGTGSFRLKMTQGADGRSLLYRTFQGPVNAGFSPDSQLLGVRTRQGTREQLYLFSTRNGSQVSRP